MNKTTKSALLKGTLHYANKESVMLQLSVYVFLEDGFTIAYCPALDLSGYGKSEEEANIDLKAVLGEYFNYTINKKTLKMDLLSLGWQLKNIGTDYLVPPNEDYFMKSNENFIKMIAEHPEMKKIDTSLQIPAFA